MDLADLELLEAVAACGSFTAAAAQLRLSQPSVSARIAAVERAVGATLFLRDSTGARPTAAGQRYLGYVSRSLRLLEDGRRAAAAEAPEPVWTIGAPASYAPAVALVLAGAAKTCGHAVSIRSGHSDDLRSQLLDTRLDLAIASPGPLPVGLASRHLLDTPIVAVRRPGKHMPDHYAIHDWGDTAEAVISDLLGRGVPRTHLAVVSPATTAIALALHGNFMAIVPTITATAELDAGRLTSIDLRLPRLTATLDWLYPIRNSKDDQLIDFIAAVRAGLRK
jgi:DNA-binding transcriptional LysR family regulator